MQDTITKFESPVRHNAERDTLYSHSHPDLDNVLHIFDADWHGIRSASGCLPGHKLTISHKHPLKAEDYRYIWGIIYNYGIDRVVFQGYSHEAGRLAYHLHRELSSRVRLHAVTHVTSAQFEHLFELEMLKLLKDQQNAGILHRLGSVKPDFHDIVHSFWPKTLYNFWPKLNRDQAPEGVLPGLQEGEAEVFVPLENTFRKNLYSNVLGASLSRSVRRVICVNEPSLLDNVMPLTKVHRIPFQAREGMFRLMSRVDLALNVTFAECQPMTQLEAIAVGTPCLTGPLKLAELDDLELPHLCTVDACDNPRFVLEAVEKVLDLKNRDPQRLQQAIEDYRTRVREMATQSYREFLYS